jgi:hypothetical protein
MGFRSGISISRLVIVPTVFAAFLVVANGAAAQEAAPAPQTARQALIEMFIGPAPGSLQKHLPEATLAALQQNGRSLLPVGEISGFAMQLQKSGQKLQTFDTGSTLLVMEDAQMGRKVEITVEKDDLRGDEDEIQLGVQSTLHDKAEALPFRPSLTMLMKQEKAVWKLNEIAFTARIPLGDPEFLKALAAQTSVAQGKAQEASAVANLRTLVTAEVSYSATYPEIGFTCSLLELGGAGKGVGPHAAQLIDERLASGEKDGYLFTIAGCQEAPSTRIKLGALPAKPGSGRVFCSDESGVIREAPSRSGVDCWRDGTVLK